MVKRRKQKRTTADKIVIGFAIHSPTVLAGTIIGARFGGLGGAGIGAVAGELTGEAMFKVVDYQEHMKRLKKKLRHKLR